MTVEEEKEKLLEHVSVCIVREEKGEEWCVCVCVCVCVCMSMHVCIHVVYMCVHLYWCVCMIVCCLLSSCL